MNNKEKKAIKDMVGGYMSLFDIREGRSCVSEYPVDLVSNHSGIGIGNLKALEERGFEFIGAGITEDGHFYISTDVHKPTTIVRIEK